MIIAGMVIPSDGEHGILSLKSISFILAAFCAGAYAIIRQKVSFYQIKLILFSCIAASTLLFWLLVSSYYGETTALAQTDQFKLFVITLFFPLLTVYLITEKLLVPQQVYKAVIYSSLAYAVMKIAMVALHLFKIVNIWELMQTLGIRFMRMDIYAGLERVQTSVDIAAPFVVFFVLQSERLGFYLSRSFKFFYIVLTLASTFLSFSRYLLAVYFMSCFLYWATLKLKPLLIGFLYFLIALCISYVAIGPEKVNIIIERRVFSLDNYQSDATRVQQIEAMVDQFEHQPYLGTGIGGFAPQYVREGTVLHLYEVQWMAFLMQFGIVGIFVLLIPLVLIGKDMVYPKFSRTRGTFLLFFLMWVFSGFTNPFLISLTSGIMYTLFYLSSQILDQVSPLQEHLKMKNSP